MLGDDEDLIVSRDVEDARDLPGLVGALDVDHAQPGTTLHRIVSDGRALPKAALRDRKDVSAEAIGNDAHLYDVIVLAQGDSADAGRSAAHGTNVRFMKS